jgi:hypothetical protein
MIILSEPGNLALRLPGAYTPRKAHSPEAFIVLPARQISRLSSSSGSFRLLGIGSHSQFLVLDDFVVFDAFNALNVVG